MNQRDLERLSEYLDGRLSPDEAIHLEARLSSDSELAAALQALRETRALLRQLPRRRSPRNFSLTPQMVSRRPPLPRFYPVLRLATAFATFLFLLVFLVRQVPFPVPAAMPMAEAGPAAPALMAATLEEQPSPEPPHTPKALAQELQENLTPATPIPEEDYSSLRIAAEPLSNVPQEAPLSLLLARGQILFGLLALLGAATMLIVRYTTARKWRA